MKQALPRLLRSLFVAALLFAGVLSAAVLVWSLSNSRQMDTAPDDGGSWHSLGFASVDAVRNSFGGVAASAPGV